MKEIVESLIHHPAVGASTLTGCGASWIGNLPIILESFFFLAGGIWVLTQTFYYIKNKGPKK